MRLEVLVYTCDSLLNILSRVNQSFVGEIFCIKAEGSVKRSDSAKSSAIVN